MNWEEFMSGHGLVEASSWHALWRKRETENWSQER